MGDRANIRLVDQGDIYLYTHWDGYKLEETLAEALDRGVNRWDDPSYLNRIIFSEMIKDEVEDETGFGISTYKVDGNYPDLVLNHHERTITCRDGNVLTFSEFVTKYKGS